MRTDGLQDVQMTLRDRDMTAHSFSGNSTSTGQQAMSDSKMNQIRELLVGEYFQQLEARIRQIETKLDQGLDAMQARIDALAAETNADSRTSFDELARNIEELARRIRQIPRE
jgi:HPt (histidine-containing phosphotransfer) domain-containing protein